jgi:hypothetical protein
MAHLMILVCAFVSGYVASFLANRRCAKSVSILAGVIAAFGFYILAWMMLGSVMDVDDEALGILLAFGFPVLIFIFIVAGWLGFWSSDQSGSW